MTPKTLSLTLPGELHAGLVRACSARAVKRGELISRVKFIRECISAGILMETGETIMEDGEVFPPAAAGKEATR